MQQRYFTPYNLLWLGVLWLCCAGMPARAARERLDVVLLLDNSGSLRQKDHKGTDEGFMRIAAMQYLLEKMQAGDRVALVTFDNNANTDAYVSHLHDMAEKNQKEDFAAGVRKIAAVPRDSTNMADGLRKSADILRREALPNHKRFLIFLTDGTPNPAKGDNTPVHLREYAEQLGREGIVIHTIGLGELSSDAREAEDAQHLLEDLARAGKGAPHRARNANDLPELFGSLFSQLAGHEISRFVHEGQDAAITLTQGAQDLRIIATRDGQAPQIVLTDPQGKTYAVSGLTPLLKEQTAIIGAVTAPAREGTWHARAEKGTLEVAYQPDFQAVLRSPANNSPIAASAPLPVIVEARQANGGLLSLPVSRVIVEYETVPGNANSVMTVTLTQDKSAKAGANSFRGTITDSGAIGPHALRARCFRMDNGVEVEGGPDYGTVQAGRIPVLSVESPPASAAFAVPGPVDVKAHVQIAGKPMETLAPGLTLAARLTPGADAAPKPLLPETGGRYAASFTLNPTSAPINANVEVTLSGSFEGAALAPQTITLPLTITPRPMVTVHWKTPEQTNIDPDGTLTFTAQVASSAPTTQTLTFELQDCPQAVLENATVLVPAHQAMQNAPVRLRFHQAAPGNYHPLVNTRLTQGDAELRADALKPLAHVRNWMERNRWWFIPLLLLLVFLVLAGLVTGYLWRQEQKRRRRMKLEQINRVSLYITGSADAFHPPYLDRYYFTVGGPKGTSDVFLYNPSNPDTPLFPETALKVEAVWRHSKALVIAYPVGMLTTLLDREGKRVPKDLALKDEINDFFIEIGGKRAEIQARRGIARTPRATKATSTPRSSAQEENSSLPPSDTT